MKVRLVKMRERRVAVIIRLCSKKIPKRKRTLLQSSCSYSASAETSSSNIRFLIAINQNTCAVARMGTVTPQANRHNAKGSHSMGEKQDIVLLLTMY